MSVEQMNQLSKDQLNFIQYLQSHEDSTLADEAFEVWNLIGMLNELKNPEQDHEYRSSLWQQIIERIDELVQLFETKNLDGWTIDQLAEIASS